MSTETMEVYMDYKKGKISKDTLIDLYLNLKKPRLIEEKMLVLLRQGKISKWFSGIGQEAIAVGVTKALEEDEYIFPMHRNLGVFTSRNMPLARLFAQWQGKASGYSKGRERSFHFGAKEHNIVGMISHLGPQLALAGGVALRNLLTDQKKVAVAFTGEGGTSEGDFHEALNVASVWDLPVIFVIENNGYGLSTPTGEQYRCEHLIDRALGYGMEGHQVDGNNILEVYNLISKLKKDLAKNPRPILIEALTFRMRGHEEASGTKYVPQELFDAWAPKDPVTNFEHWLISEEIITEDFVKETELAIKAEINESLEISWAEEAIVPNTAVELADIYAPFEYEHTAPATENKTEKRLVDAVSDGLRQSMERHDDLIIMGQDVAEYGGVFKITEGFTEQFGRGRVRNTPICESSIVGIGLGHSIAGGKAVIEMQFADFVTVAFNQIVNNLAKLHYRWGEKADVVVRMPSGGGVAAGPFHSQSNEAWFFHTPGLKVVYPSTPAEAKGLLAASINDPNPVIFFEHKALYRNPAIAEEVHDDYYTIELGKANLVNEGDDITIITYGSGVHWAKEALAEYPDISADLLDLRTLLPYDKEAIFASVKKTGKAIILHEDCLTGGIGGEIAAVIAEECFESLDAPVKRTGSLDTPVPFVAQLEQNFLPKERFKKDLLDLFEY